MKMMKINRKISTMMAIGAMPSKSILNEHTTHSNLQ